jgi:hypothetical protein
MGNLLLFRKQQIPRSGRSALSEAEGPRNDSAFARNPGVKIQVVSSRDTTPAAQAIQLEILRTMSGEQRLLLAFEMSELARELAKAGIRRQHPEWSETRVTRELLKLAFYPAPLPAGFDGEGQTNLSKSTSAKTESALMSLPCG